MKTAKTEQRILKAVLALLLILAALTSLAACKKGEVDDEGVATVVVAVGEDIRAYEVPLDELDGEAGAIALLDYLKAEGELDYVSEDSGYGPYLTAVGHLSQDVNAGVYVGIWTSVAADQDNESTYATTVTYEGAELVSAAVGLGQLSVPDGAVIYFGELRY